MYFAGPRDMLFIVLFLGRRSLVRYVTGCSDFRLSSCGAFGVVGFFGEGEPYDLTYG